MKPSLIRKPPARKTASRSGTAHWCSMRIRAAAESLGISSSTSQASFVGEDLNAVGGRLGTRLGAGHEAFLALDAEPDQRADLAAELDRLIL